MFKRLGNWASQYRYIIIIGWVIIAVGLLATAPDMESVATSDQRDFMPSNAPFAHAQEVFEQTFPAEFSASSSIILIQSAEGETIDSPAIEAYIIDLVAWLRGDESPDIITDVGTPSDSELLEGILISPDRRILLVSIAFSTPTDSQETIQAIYRIDDWIEEHPPQGFAVYQTGEAGLNAQAEESTFTTIDRTIFLTFALVIVALLVIYRSPVSPLIPLFSVTIAFLVTQGVIGHLAQAGIITVVAQVNALLVVVMYGAGTDYCLFLISRFREEMADKHETSSAVKSTVHMVGETITSSAATIFVGFMAMIFAEIGMIRNAGPMLGLGIVFSLLAGLTLTPALLAILGDRAFFPFKASHRSHGKYYETTSKLVSNRPLLTIGVIVVIMLPFSIHGLNRPVNYDFVAELPEHLPSVKAYHLLGEHMGAGNLFMLTAIVTERETANLPTELTDITSKIMSVQGVNDVRSIAYPLGTTQADKLPIQIDQMLPMILTLDDSQLADGTPFAELRPLLEAYTANERTAYRLDIILDDPLGEQGRYAVEAIRDILTDYGDSGEAVLSGFSVITTDLSTIMSQDTGRVVVFVLGGIFVVLLIMLRSVVAPLYLIGTVLLSFTCTLGLTNLFFNTVFGVENLSWMLPFFTFVFLVGLGIDYSVFLFGRIKEEVGNHGIREGVHVAVAATGAIITSAAIILAGTFAGMMTGELMFLAQMGFAVSVGVIIDAFIVRTLLDPALAVIFGKWTWFPGGVPKAQSV